EVELFVRERFVAALLHQRARDRQPELVRQLGRAANGEYGAAGLEKRAELRTRLRHGHAPDPVAILWWDILRFGHAIESPARGAVAAGNRAGGEEQDVEPVRQVSGVERGRIH